MGEEESGSLEDGRPSGMIDTVLFYGRLARREKIKQRKWKSIINYAQAYRVTADEFSFPFRKFMEKLLRAETHRGCLDNVF